jgi:hypothetical protein
MTQEEIDNLTSIERVALADDYIFKAGKILWQIHDSGEIEVMKKALQLSKLDLSRVRRRLNKFAHLQSDQSK